MRFRDCFDNIFEMNVLDKIVRNDFNRIVSSCQFIPLEEKVKQYFYTSLPIQFGYSLEKVVRRLVEQNGGVYLDRKIGVLDCDQLYELNGVVYLIEQKVRDDHDSSKKKGQVENFFEKKKKLKEAGYQVKACSWFIDADFHKNKSFYEKELGDEVRYGKEIDEFVGFGLYDELMDVIRSFRNEFRPCETFKPLDFTNYTPAKLAPILMNENMKYELREFFFGGIDKTVLLEYLNKCRKTAINKTLIAYVKNED